MWKLDFSPQARVDLFEIWTYVAADNVKAADKLVKGFQSKFELILKTPTVGRSRPDIATDLRSFSSGRYVIIYRFGDRAVEIVRVLHSALDLSSIFE